VVDRLAAETAAIRDVAAVAHDVDARVDAAAEQAAGRDLHTARDLVARVELADEAAFGERALGANLLRALLECRDRGVEVVELLAFDAGPAANGELVARQDRARRRGPGGPVAATPRW
jgi:hypothetical protein